jgi:hypothetical protein
VLSPDFAIFADTQDEPAYVYEHVARMTAWAAERGVEVRTVTRGKLSEAWLRDGRPCPPLFTVAADGKRGMLQRQCTADYKIVPIRQEIRREMAARGLKPRAGLVTQMLGISTDEADRMKPAPVAYIRNVWPLIDRGMSRADCLRLCESEGIRVPGKSACIYCPFHSRGYWRALKAEAPADYAAAVAFDEATRRGVGRMTASMYVHRDLVPLAQVRDEALPPGADGWGNECEGLCGV